MLNRSASLAMSTSVLKALPGKLDIKRHSPSILYFSKTIFVFKQVLESFKIMDYSLLVGVHNLDEAAREKVRVLAIQNLVEKGVTLLIRDQAGPEF